MSVVAICGHLKRCAALYIVLVQSGQLGEVYFIGLIFAGSVKYSDLLVLSCASSFVVWHCSCSCALMLGAFWFTIGFRVSEAI